jgi:tetratricopeptide (TPR) repeat protein
MSSESESPTVSPQQAQKAQSLFQYGNEAAQKGNFDYAIQMYRDACKILPENLLYRQALRGIERRKFHNDPSKVGMLVGARVQPIRLKVKAHKAKGKWLDVLNACEEAFVHNPWDVGSARDAAEAAEALGFKLLAQWYLESVQNEAKDAEFFRFLAHVHEINASWPKAIAAWERVKKIDPTDENAFRQMNQLSANATIQKAGLGEAIDKRNEPAAVDLAAELEEMKAAKLTPEERLLQTIKEVPDRVGPYLELADLYKNRSQLDEAEKLLGRGLKALPKDNTIRQAYAEVQISRLQRSIAGWTQKAKEQPNDDAVKAKLEQLSTMLNDYEVKEYKRRLSLYPEDLQLHFSLGLRLARGGKHEEAIAAFQQARNSPTLKVQALHQTGLSFEAKNALKLAERTYLDALKSADPADTSTLNALHYRLGRVSEALGNTAAAEEHYNEVAANDYSYLDVAQRLQNLA